MVGLGNVVEISTRVILPPASREASKVTFSSESVRVLT